MRLYSISFLFLVTFLACSTNKSKDKTQFATEGSLLLFDTTSGKYVVSSVDKKLISTWESFRHAISKSDYTTLRALSCDSIICPHCVSAEENSVMPADTFYKHFAKSLFLDPFSSLIFDSTKIRCRYDFNNTNFDAYPFLTTISDLKNPKIAEIFISFPVSDGNSEGTTAILDFIETKLGYKFFSCWSIP
jgi:hypothetical protein